MAGGFKNEIVAILVQVLKYELIREIMLLLLSSDID